MTREENFGEKKNVRKMLPYELPYHPTTTIGIF